MIEIIINPLILFEMIKIIIMRIIIKKMLIRFQQKTNSNKIFSESYFLSYKNQKWEKKYQKSSNRLFEENFLIGMNSLLVIGTLITCLELYFYISTGMKVKALQYNVNFCFIHLIVTIFFLAYMRKKDRSQFQKLKLFSMTVLEFLIEDFFMSLLSVLYAHYHFGVEILTFIYVCKIIFKAILFFILSHFVLALKVFIFHLVILWIGLLSTHKREHVIYYLAAHTGFICITLIMSYVYELMKRKYLYSQMKLLKEKKYFWETINFLDVSYFSYKNGGLEKLSKIDELMSKFQLGNSEKDKSISIEVLEKLLSTIECSHILPLPVQKYIECSRTGNNFNFSHFVKFLVDDPSYKDIFKRFTVFGIIKSSNTEASLSQETVVQLFIKLTLKNIQNSQTIKMECLFLDISQIYLKTEIQLNSFYLSKYIHDIKSPLFLLDRIITQFRESLESSEMIEIEEYTKYFHQTSDYIFQMIHIINNFTKKQNKFKYNTEPSDENECCEIRSMIQSCVNFYQIYSKFSDNKTNISLSYHVDNEIPKRIICDAPSIKQILMNLLSNAMKFTYNGEIKVIGRKVMENDNDRILEFTVSDTGIGIPEENLAQIGQPFRLTTDRIKGSGLGISIVNDLLKSMKSKLKIKSQVGVGSDFSFNINYSLPEEAPALGEEFEEKNKHAQNVTFLRTNSPSINRESIDISEKRTAKREHTMIKRYKHNQHYQNFIRETLSDYSEHNNDNTLEDNQSLLSNNDISFLDISLKEITEDDNVNGQKRYMKVLIIDDDSSYLSQFELLLKSIEDNFVNARFAIDKACDTIEALSKIYQGIKKSEQPFEIIFSDHNMPFLSGVDFARVYKEEYVRNGFYNVAFVMTSSDMISMEGRCNKYISGVLSKPSTKKDLLRVMSILGYKVDS